MTGAGWGAWLPALRRRPEAAEAAASGDGAAGCGGQAPVLYTRASSHAGWVFGLVVRCCRRSGPAGAAQPPAAVLSFCDRSTRLCASALQRGDMV